MSVRDYAARNRLQVGSVLALLALVAGLTVLFDLPIADIVTVGYVQRSFQAATPIALAAIGGLYAEKSGVFNIGLEGFMIFGAVNAAAAAYLLSSGDQASQATLWLAILVAVLINVILTLAFAVLTIRYEANQIVAGLAVWFVGLGFGPFTSILIWGDVSSPPINSIAELTIPVLADIPILGRLLFDTSPLVLLTVVIAVVAWVVLYHTRYGYWIQAAGENPEALDTAGVGVNRVRYAAVLFSGAMSGLAGAVVSIGIGNGFVGTGVTMVDGRGWIAIVAYLFGNYNPIGAYLASLLFGAMDLLQVQLQTVGISISANITGLFPYVVVIVVLTLFGSTRVPSAVGESYESED
ncbi:ABC transporter permease [Halorhabdus rudnickae]|uniref:ABC transporter permease n=1 Tax=Halorhabdus rudnickae TaxID=1775544 RepID=UPI0010824AE2|nr:ABC transporter permease [Halorhabdus rudnickae]